MSEGSIVADYPHHLSAADDIAPVPRRIRGFLAGGVVFDTTAALYVWEWPPYPHYYIPLADVRPGVLVDENHMQHTHRGPAQVFGIRVGDTLRTAAARVYRDSPLPHLTGTVRFDWAALDSWFEEDEQVFVHPRNPYVRVDALRSTRHVRVALNGTVLAESDSPVLVFETGLPTRYYLPRTNLRFEHLVDSSTMTACPYKGTTSQYLSAVVDDQMHQDVAWCYDFPTRQLLPIAGLVAFYQEKVDIMIDGVPVPRPPGRRAG